jgi:two-component system phosphate regulon sensor histidine kinase PhoR
MIRRLFNYDPLKTFYAVFAYIVLFSCWWGYLLFEKNETAFMEKVELSAIQFNEQHPQVGFDSTPEYQKLHNKYARQRLMIFAEGSVFLALLIIGFFQIRKAITKEMELAEQQRNFLLSITHELKSPISTVKLSLQTMLKRTLEPDKSEKLINHSLADVDRLESLVDNILFAAKIERNSHGFSSQEVNVSEVLYVICERFMQNKKQIKVKPEIAENIYLNTDTIGFSSVAINLIENAVKYSPEATNVTVTLSENNNNVMLQVADEGIGIADAEKKKIFDKFYRIGSEDTRNTKGTGLGLYIVKRFVEIYKGVILIKDNKPKGTVFELQFPKLK